MSWDHGTYGWEAYELLIGGLQALGIKYTEELKDEEYVRGMDSGCRCHETKDGGHYKCPNHQRLRIAYFTICAEATLKLRRMVVEEYLSVKDRDCDGISSVAIAVYEKGERPNLATQVLEA